MRLTLLTLCCCGAALLATPDASAVTCYLVLDRNDNVVYQDIYPPVDLSDEGAAERKAMRARNEHMIAMETDRCAPLEFVPGGPGVAGARINLENVGDPIVGSTAKPPGNATAAPTTKRTTSPPASKAAPSNAPAKTTKSGS
jgi:hypothetical protein